MAKKGGDDWWKALLVFVGGGLVLYGLKVALEEEKGGAPVPADPGGRINRVVNKLNQKFGHDWVTKGLEALRAYIGQVLPASEVALVNVVYEVENQPRLRPITGSAKQQLAIQKMQQLRLT